MLNINLIKKGTILYNKRAEKICISICKVIVINQTIAAIKPLTSNMQGGVLPLNDETIYFYNQNTQKQVMIAQTLFANFHLIRSRRICF